MAPIPKPRFIVACRKANALERRPSPTTDASSESAAGHEIDAPRPITAAAPNASTAEWTNANQEAPAAPVTSPSINVRREPIRSDREPPIRFPAKLAIAIVARANPAAGRLRPRTRCR